MRTARKLWKYALALARELGDESAYARYLNSSGRTASRAEWRAFIDGRHRRKYQNPKCC